MTFNGKESNCKAKNKLVTTGNCTYMIGCHETTDELEHVVELQKLPPYDGNTTNVHRSNITLSRKTNNKLPMR